MPRLSAGLLMYRFRVGSLEVFLAHPGGPLFRNKDEGVWSIPKGEPEPEEDLLDTARREFEEETGVESGGAVPAIESHSTERRQDRSCLGLRGRLRSENRPKQHVLRWNGRRTPANRWNFPKSTGPNFSMWRRRKQKIKAGQEKFIEELIEKLKCQKK